MYRGSEAMRVHQLKGHEEGPILPYIALVFESQRIRAVFDIFLLLSIPHINDNLIWLFHFVPKMYYFA